MSLAPSEDKGYRIVVDVFRRVDGPPGDGPPLICVDAGHGGEDSGAIGVTGAKEKDLNLAIGLVLAQNLREAGLSVMMTREDDTYPTLEEPGRIWPTLRPPACSSASTTTPPATQMPTAPRPSTGARRTSTR